MGSAPFRLAAGDLWSVLKHAIISAVAIAAPVLLSGAEQIGKAALSAAVAAAASTGLKLLTQFVADTRPQSVRACTLATAKRHK